MNVKPEHLLLMGAAALALAWAGRAVAAAGEAVDAAGDALDRAQLATTDLFAWITGLDAYQEQLLNNPDAARVYLALE